METENIDDDTAEMLCLQNGDVKFYEAKTCFSSEPDRISDKERIRLLAEQLELAQHQVSELQAQLTATNKFYEHVAKAFTELKRVQNAQKKPHWEIKYSQLMRKYEE